MLTRKKQRTLVTSSLSISCTCMLLAILCNIFFVNQVLDNPGRGTTVRERIQRMKDEKVLKLERTFKKVAKCKAKLEPFLSLERVSLPVKECDGHEATLRRALKVTTWAEYEAAEREFKAQQEARQAASSHNLLGIV